MMKDHRFRGYIGQPNTCQLCGGAPGASIHFGAVKVVRPVRPVR